MAIQSLKQQGYLLIDHQASPGIPADVAEKIGMPAELVGEGKRLEADTLTCAHCKTTQIKNPLRTRERASCAKCGHHYICDMCAIKAREPDYSHFPYDKFRDLTVEGYGMFQTIGVPLVLGSSPSLITKPEEIVLYDGASNRSGGEQKEEANVGGGDGSGVEGPGDAGL